eukprot:4629243-Pleurochrysis_carterae.AAC.2
MLYNPHLPSDFLTVPRILPPPEKFQAELVELSNMHGLSISENDLVSFQSLRSQFLDMALEKPAELIGVELSSFAVERPLRACIQFDAAGSELARGGDHTNETRPGAASLTPLQRLGQAHIDIGPHQRRQGR